MATRQIRNGLRSLLSLTGGRLPAEQAVSKPDAEAARERRLGKLIAYICQGLTPKSTQNCGSNISQLLRGNASGNKFPFSARTSAPVLEPIKARTSDRRDHITLRPHLDCCKGVRQWLLESNQHMIGLSRVRRRRAQRNNCYDISASRESWDDNDNWSALDHFWNHKAMKVAQQDFTDFGIVHKRH